MKGTADKITSIFQRSNKKDKFYVKTEGLVVALLTSTSSTSNLCSKMSSFSFKAASLLFVVASGEAQNLTEIMSLETHIYGV